MSQKNLLSKQIAIDNKIIKPIPTVKNNLMIKTVSKFEARIAETTPNKEFSPPKPQTAKVLKRLNKFSHPRMVKT